MKMPCNDSELAQQPMLDNVVNGRPVFEGMGEFVGDEMAGELQALSDYAISSLESMTELSAAVADEFAAFQAKLWPQMPDLPDGVDRFAQHPIAGEPGGNQ